MGQGLDRVRFRQAWFRAWAGLGQGWDRTERVRVEQGAGYRAEQSTAGQGRVEQCKARQGRARQVKGSF